jgi:hypothetical protein
MLNQCHPPEEPSPDPLAYQVERSDLEVPTPSEAVSVATIRHGIVIATPVVSFRHGARPDSYRTPRSCSRHAKCDSSKNPRTTLVIDLARERKRKEERELTTPHVVDLVRKAEEWQGLLDRGEVKNRAELARRFGVSAMRVSIILALLKLHPDIRAAIRALPPGTPERLLTERKLRDITAAPPKAQLRALDWFLGRKAAG